MLTFKRRIAWLLGKVSGIRAILYRKIYPYQRIYKRFRHLLYRFRYENILRDTERKFHFEAQRKYSVVVVDLFNPLPRTLSKVRKNFSSMYGVENNSPYLLRRKIPSKFCQTVRLFRRLSSRDLCLLLNAHKEIARLDDMYPCFHWFYPFTPKFIEKFENNIEEIPDYWGSGLLGGIGFPCQEFTRLVAKICNAESDFEEFEAWSNEFLKSKCAVTNVEENKSFVENVSGSTNIILFKRP